MLMGYFIVVKKNGCWLVVVYDVVYEGIEVVIVYEVLRKI